MTPAPQTRVGARREYPGSLVEIRELIARTCGTWLRCDLRPLDRRA